MIQNLPYSFEADDYDEAIKKFFETTVSKIVYKVKILLFLLLLYYYYLKKQFILLF